MGAVQELLGKKLPARTGTWEIVRQLSTDANHYGGASSIGFEVKRQDGYLAFMKATDIDLTTEENHSMFERTYTMMTAHQFERQILEYCEGSNMDRIVVAIDYGEALVEFDGVRQPVFFLVFEMANCDLRVHCREGQKLSLVWMLGTLHNLAVGIRQLHLGQVCHNDIKPANILVFNLSLQKIADLGKATSLLYPALHDSEVCAGDPQYAAPELLYHTTDVQPPRLSAPSFDARRAADLFQLGSVAFYTLGGRMITPEVIQALNPEHRPPNSEGGWCGSFVDVVPYWREAFARVQKKLKDSLSARFEGAQLIIAQEVLTAVAQLCEPNPMLRGHPVSRWGKSDEYSVERYVSLFDRLRLRAMIQS